MEGLQPSTLHFISSALYFRIKKPVCFCTICRRSTDVFFHLGLTNQLFGSVCSSHTHFMELKFREEKATQRTQGKRCKNVCATWWRRCVNCKLMLTNREDRVRTGNNRTSRFCLHYQNTQCELLKGRLSPDNKPFTHYCLLGHLRCLVEHKIEMQI